MKLSSEVHLLLFLTFLKVFVIQRGVGNPLRNTKLQHSESLTNSDADFSRHIPNLFMADSNFGFVQWLSGPMYCEQINKVPFFFTFCNFQAITSTCSISVIEILLRITMLLKLFLIFSLESKHVINHEKITIANTVSLNFF